MEQRDGCPSRKPPLIILADDRDLLERWVRVRTTPRPLLQRSQIVLLAAKGVSHRQTAQQLDTTRDTVRRWRLRFAARGADALTFDSRGRGRKSRVCLATLETVLRAPRRETTSVRPLATRLGVSPSAVHRALHRRHNLNLRKNKPCV